jgi:hypothetical protein
VQEEKNRTNRTDDMLLEGIHLPMVPFMILRRTVTCATAACRIFERISFKCKGYCIECQCNTIACRGGCQCLCCSTMIHHQKNEEPR